MWEEERAVNKDIAYKSQDIAYRSQWEAIGTNKSA